MTTIETGDDRLSRLIMPNLSPRRGGREELGMCLEDEPAIANFFHHLHDMTPQGGSGSRRVYFNAGLPERKVGRKHPDVAAFLPYSGPRHRLMKEPAEGRFELGASALNIPERSDAHPVGGKEGCCRFLISAVPRFGKSIRLVDNCFFITESRHTIFDTMIE